MTLRSDFPALDHRRPSCWLALAIGLSIGALQSGCIVPYEAGETSGTGGAGTTSGSGGATGTSTSGTTGTGGAGGGTTTGGPCGALGEACCAGDVCDDPTSLTCDGGTCLGCVSKVIQSSAGGGGCLERKDGTTYCWGDNSYSQLSCVGGPYLPMPISGLGTASVAAVGGHICAIGVGGDLLCWGDNGHGQSGADPVLNEICPTQMQTVDLPSPAASIAVGSLGTTIVELEDGRVFGMGNNNDGQLAINGTYDASPHPTPVELTVLGAGNKDVAASGRVTCVVKDGGEVRCVGNNQNYELGTTQVVPFGTPADVPISAVDELQAGADFYCALKGSEVWCWGGNYWWQLGSAAAPDPSATPVQVPIDPVKQLAVGHEHVCALLTNDTVTCWGHNNHSQLGTCGASYLLPTQVFLDEGGTVPLVAKQITSTGLVTCALDLQDRVWCWGRNAIYEAGVDNGQMEVCPPAQIALDCK